jgi:hypothetical protein
VIVAATHTEAADLIHGVLTAVEHADVGAASTVQLQPAPMPTAPITGPALIVQTPQALTQRGVGACTWTFTVGVLAVSATTLGTGLLALVDKACHELTKAGVIVTTSPTIYQPPGTPAPVPAVLISGE